ncbi:hypothetical protein ACFW4O_22915 [Streptomyces mutabilis]|uniref:hypothetical protein n=1 Tax=Streptomyces TaxID=1883 RepID=UPI000BD2B4C9|nr:MULTISPECIES: hypothetical protein [unclassified Streptomyces]MDN3248636.1 hypothetical protein [Streptomyces sp. ZSW22]MDN3256624.1 hypothetical protein [Streptomyces sp. MA25(2023)]MDQ0388500.1 hypothetical protein [Streptomyces sp. DSM 42143]PAK22566.1 hypothetical protein CJD44_34485 [Streptomyces sp. alain-838]
MTPTLVPAPAAAPVGTTRTRRSLRAVAVLACLPYLGLKVAWIAGSRAGIPEGSALLDHRATMIAANGVTLLLDSCVIVLALILTRPWGLRVPAWALAFPVWVAGGLLAPIMAGFPLQLLTRALGGDTATEPGPGRELFLDPWVFGVVYTGFIVQGLALGALFALYARDRWGHLWRGRVRELPVGVVARPYRAVALAGAVLAAFPLAVRLYWVCGGTAGLKDADRTADLQVLEGMHAGFLVAAVTGTLLLAFHRARVLPVTVPLASAWVCSGAVACWGGWMLLAALLPSDDPADRPTQLLAVTYAGQMTAGLLLASVGAHFLARRSATARTRP